MLELDNLGFWLNWNRKLFIQINLGKLHIGSHFNVCKYCCKASTRQIKFCNLQGHCDLWIVIVSKTLQWDYVHWAPTKKSNCQGHFICSKLEGQHAKHFKQLCCWKMCGWVGGWMVGNCQGQGTNLASLICTGDFDGGELNIETFWWKRGRQGCLWDSTWYENQWWRGDEGWEMLTDLAKWRPPPSWVATSLPPAPACLAACQPASLPASSLPGTKARTNQSLEKHLKKDIYVWCTLLSLVNPE